MGVFRLLPVTSEISLFTMDNGAEERREIGDIGDKTSVRSDATSFSHLRTGGTGAI